MSDFLTALKQSTKRPVQFNDERQSRIKQAELLAGKFYDELQRSAHQLAEFGVTAQLSDRTISFKRGRLEILVVTFGTDGGTKVRIFSPIAEYFKLTPSYEDLNVETNIGESAGRWLGRSIELVEQKKDVLAALELL